LSAAWSSIYLTDGSGTAHRITLGAGPE